MIKKLFSALALACVLSGAANFALGMDIQDIKAMAKEGVPENVILNMIQAEANPRSYTPKEIIELHNAGLSADFLQAIVNPDDQSGTTSDEGGAVAQSGDPDWTSITVDQPLPPLTYGDGWLAFSNYDFNDYSITASPHTRTIFVFRELREGLTSIPSGNRVSLALPHGTYKLYGGLVDGVDIEVKEGVANDVSLAPFNADDGVGLFAAFPDGSGAMQSYAIFGHVSAANGQVGATAAYEGAPPPVIMLPPSITYVDAPSIPPPPPIVYLVPQYVMPPVELAPPTIVSFSVGFGGWGGWNGWGWDDNRYPYSYYRPYYHGSSSYRPPWGAYPPRPGYPPPPRPGYPPPRPGYPPLRPGVPPPPRPGVPPPINRPTPVPIRPMPAPIVRPAPAPAPAPVRPTPVPIRPMPVPIARPAPSPAPVIAPPAEPIPRVPVSRPAQPPKLKIRNR